MRPAEHAIACPLGEGVAILDTRENKYFSLNAVGAFIWERLGAKSPDEIAAEISKVFEVDPSICRSDMDALIIDLQNAGLLEL